MLLKLGSFSGFFQAFMPLVGWFCSLKFSNYIKSYDHWVAFILLLIIGLKMIYETTTDEDNNFNPLNNKILLLLAIATSIDALAVGVSFACLKVAILPSVMIIGWTTFILSAPGVFIGKTGGNLLQNKAQIIGGLILIFIGTRILFEHLNINIVSILNFIP